MPDPLYVKAAFGRIADRYVSTNHILSLGTDILWRRKVAQKVALWSARNLLDVATGTGDLALAIQKYSPQTEVIGTDFCEEMLAHASRRGVKKTLQADAMALPFEDNSFDVLTVAFGLRNMEHWQKALEEMKRVLRPKGHLAVLDFSLPQNLLAKPYAFYLDKMLPKMAGFLTGDKHAYAYLAKSIHAFPSGKDMCQLMECSGFIHPTSQPLSGGIASLYTAEKKRVT